MQKFMIENLNARIKNDSATEISSVLEMDDHIFQTRFIQMYRQFELCDDLEIELQSVAAYVGEFGMFLNAKCNESLIGIGVHPIFSGHEFVSAPQIEEIKYVLMSADEMNAMISFQNSKNNLGYALVPDELIFIDDFDFSIDVSACFQKNFLCGEG